MTADCTPILLYDYKKNIIAAIHAGWKGAFKGIVKRVIKFMLEKGCRNNIIALLAPVLGEKVISKRRFFKKIHKKIEKTKYFLKKKI